VWKDGALDVQMTNFEESSGTLL